MLIIFEKKVIISALIANIFLNIGIRNGNKSVIKN